MGMSHDISKFGATTSGTLDILISDARFRFIGFMQSR